MEGLFVVIAQPCQSLRDRLQRRDLELRTHAASPCRVSEVNAEHGAATRCHDRRSQPDGRRVIRGVLETPSEVTQGSRVLEQRLLDLERLEPVVDYEPILGPGAVRCNAILQA